MIWKTALKTLCRNLGLNLLHMLQMAAVMLVSAVMVSAICIRYQTYLPFQDYFEGEACSVSSRFLQVMGTFITWRHALPRRMN